MGYSAAIDYQKAVCSVSLIVFNTSELDKSIWAEIIIQASYRRRFLSDGPVRVSVSDCNLNYSVNFAKTAKVRCEGAHPLLVL